jgi:hypothetical protein
MKGPGPEIIMTTGDNYLPDLAARIKVEHGAVQDALNNAVMRAMVAGDLLLEAKALVRHGEWLPWLEEHCEVSERTAQLYMKLAGDRERVESIIRTGADLSINQAAGLASMSLKEKDAFEAMKRAFGGLELKYDPWAGRSENDQKTAALFALFLVERCGFSVEGAQWRAEYDLAGRGFAGLDELLGPPGDTFRVTHFGKAVTDGFKTDCRAFIADRLHMTEADIGARFDELHSQERLERPVKRKRKPKAQRIADLPVSKEDRREAIQTDGRPSARARRYRPVSYRPAVSEA